MSSAARMCLLVLTVLFQIGVWQAAWSSGRVSSASTGMSAPVKAAASHAREGLPPPLGDAAPAEGARDERPTTMADDIFEIAALPVNVPRVKAAPAEGRADLAFDGLPCGRPGSETPDKPPRA